MFGILIKGQFPSNTWEKSGTLALALRRFRVANLRRKEDDQNSEKKTKDPESGEKPKITKEFNAKEKLNDLLKLMMKDGPLVNTKGDGLTLAKPKRITKPKPEKTVKDGIVTSVEIDRQLVEATKSVAESLRGDVKETESELLEKLLSTKGRSNLSDVIGGMKIDHGDDESKTRKELSKDWNQIRQEDVQARKPSRHMLGGRRERYMRGEPAHIDLFGGSGLGIFGQEMSLSKDVSSPPSLEVWDTQEARELRLATAQPPRNYYQQMILWTEQGKLWKFPIDNEQGLDEEKKVFFTEHVFLEPHLEPWCPKKGPIRHFMELVCVGLSKNPYMSVQQKKDTINWYAEYFEAKKDILKEVGALPQ